MPTDGATSVAPALREVAPGAADRRPSLTAAGAVPFFSRWPTIDAPEPGLALELFVRRHWAHRDELARGPARVSVERR